MKNLKRTCYCGEVTEEMVGKEITIMGWVKRKRILSYFSFILIRDRTGFVQTVINQETNTPDILEKDKEIKPEYVVAIKGIVTKRTDENINPKMKTGSVEIIINEMEILAESQMPPFQIEDSINVSTDLRLKYRYLDIRRPSVLENLILRHKIVQSVRRFLDNDKFLEIETPFLTRSTPEGARDYLVPSRIHEDKFYALPQSPQIFKQLLMISGVDKYFQIVKCFRDEDLRADRQPEFTQIDMELSFVDEEDIIKLNENLMKTILKDTRNIDIKVPFERMKFDDVMDRFGSDKPDVRFGMELKNITHLVKNSEFIVFKNAIMEGGSVRGINVEGASKIPRKQIDTLVEFSKEYGAKGLCWIGLNEDGTFKTSISKFFTEEELKEIANYFEAKIGDLILICADKNKVVFNTLGALRNEMAKRLELVKKDDFKFLWVTDFPLVEYDDEQNRYVATHHPFTSPKEEDIDILETNLKDVRARAYDIVLNGFEIGGGSIRISDSKLQAKMFKALGFTDEQAIEQFGFLIEAFKYGAPPHGGLALGLDRIAMILSGSESIRDVIAFPKVKDASCPLTEAPNYVDDKQIDELHLKKR